MKILVHVEYLQRYSKKFPNSSIDIRSQIKTLVNSFHIRVSADSNLVNKLLVFRAHNLSEIESKTFN